ncbi:hypothetical protein B194_2072 [Serratia plymuthica A30]|nr:hypothetical protein B194_2072 [Serratia plymuthica A30]
MLRALTAVERSKAGTGLMAFASFVRSVSCFCYLVIPKRMFRLFELKSFNNLNYEINI